MTSPDPSGCEREYDFVLVLTGVATLTDEQADALFTAGCDDATPSVRNGAVFLTFSRSAHSLKDAVLSAIRNVRESGTGADVRRVDHHDGAREVDLINTLLESGRYRRTDPVLFEEVAQSLLTSVNP